MTAISDWLELAILDLVLRGQAYTGASTIYAALYTTATDDGASGTEVVGNGYSRVLVPSFDPPAAGVCSNSASVTFGPATASWGVVTHFALYDGSGGAANRLFHGPLTIPKTVSAGDSFVFPIGNISVKAD